MDDVLRFLLDASIWISTGLLAVAVYVVVFLLAVVASIWAFEDGIVQILMSWTPAITWTGLGTAYGQGFGLLGAAAGLVFLWLYWLKVPEVARGPVWFFVFMLPTSLFIKLTWS